MLFKKSTSAKDESVSTAEPTAAPWQILIVDDEPEVHMITKLALRDCAYLGRQVSFLSAYSGIEALKILRNNNNDIALAFVDVVMETDTAGLDLVNQVRKDLNDHNLRIILRTGQPGQAPERKVIHEFDINDYINKTSLTADKLYTATLASLRGYHDIMTLADSHKKLAAANAKYSELNENLEKHVQERTATLAKEIEEKNLVVADLKSAQQALAAAKDQAEEATRTKSDFLANMSHEIRTPMNAIIGMSYLALQRNLDSKVRNYISNVNRAAENLLGIINDILDFSKIEAGKMSLEVADFSLEEVMENLANLIGHKATGKGLELNFDIPASLPLTLQGDSLRLGQILLNLANNAVKFTESGHILVGVESIAQTQNAIELHFWLQDSGIGMNEAQCAKMFQSFIQADSSTTRKYGGTGLGLVISKNLVEAMNGRIWVESTPDVGSTFHFHAQFGLPVNSTELAKPSIPINLQGKSALVVDDSLIAREILNDLVKRLGMTASPAIDSADAITKIADSIVLNRPFDLILMDWKMPLMDGLDCIEELKAAHTATLPPVILVTAFGHDEITEIAATRGIHLSGSLYKPVTTKALQNAILQALGSPATLGNQSHKPIAGNNDGLQQINGARLLLVEDNEMNQELAMELLATANISVVIANHGQEALDILATDANFDGVLMDCQMPVMDGYTATQAIRKNPSLQHLLIIAMTANAMSSDRDKVLAAGMNDFIAKPLNVKTMFETIARWVKVKKTDVSNHAANNALVSNTPSANSHTNNANSATGAFPAIAGIDTTKGLTHCMNNVTLYNKVLKAFNESAKQFASSFASAQNSNDPTAAMRAAHTIKGTASIVGAVQVEFATAALEAMCSNNNASEAEISAMLNNVLEALAPVLVELAARFPTINNT